MESNNQNGEVAFTDFTHRDNELSEENCSTNDKGRLIVNNDEMKENKIISNCKETNLPITNDNDVWAEEEEDEEGGGFLRFLFRHSTVRRPKPRDTTDDVTPDNSRRSLRRSLRRLFRRNESFCRAQTESDILNQEETTTPDADENLRVNLPDVISRGEIQEGATRCSSGVILDNGESEESDSTPPSQVNRSNQQNQQQRPSVQFTVNRVDIPVIVTPPSPPPPQQMSINQGLTMRNILLEASNEETNTSSNARVTPSVSSSDSPVQPVLRSRPQSTSTFNANHETDEERSKRVGFWPHLPSSLLAVMACTLGMSNICRFAFLCFQYGAAFMIQFAMLSISFGFPMLSFFMTLGQYMGSGVMDMWKISPVFQGVGVASLMASMLLGIYSIIPVSWLFVYFRDSFVTNGIFFKWGECSSVLKHDYLNCKGQNLSETFRKTVPNYFYGRVLQRSSHHPSASSFGELKFENVFNLAMVWLLVFVCLSKGLKSYGKVVFVFAFFPLIGILLVSIELLRQAENGTEYIITTNTYMVDVFTSGAAWAAAAREVFFTWGINGAAVMQITSHNRYRHNIKRDSSVVIFVTLTTLIVVGFLGCACFSIILRYERNSINFLASSFETERNIIFLAPNPDPRIPLRYHWSNNLILGEEMMTEHTDSSQQSNYQVLRFITELFPAAVANLGPNNISPFWCVLFYLTLITFALAQQLAIWRCVIEGIMAIKPQVLRTWESTITFIMCVVGFVLGLPATTELGIFVVYFMDYCIGGAWWIMITYLVLVLAVFIVRGKPFSADDLVSLLASDKFTRKWLANLISFSWSVIFPVGLLVLSIVSFRNGKYSRIFNWFEIHGYRYWPLWVRQIGTLIQLIPLFCIPLFALIQTCRYLSKGPPDLFDRLQMLYRPVMRTPPDGQHQTTEPSSGATGVENPAFSDDPPPKYTPPPSYNTATGLKLLKRLNSLRRSLRAQFPGRSSATSNGAGGEVELTSGQVNCPSVLAPSVFVLPRDLHAPSTSQT